MKIESFQGTDYFKGDAPEFVIENFLPARRLMMISSVEGGGKTKFALTIARSVATGSPFFGFDTQQGKIAYFNMDLNDPYDIQQRCKELGDGDDSWASQVTWYDGSLNFLKPILFDDDGMVQTASNGDPFLVIDQLIKDLDSYKLVIVDTLSKLATCADLDERSEKDMGMLIEVCLRLARRTGAAVVLLHHRPKNQEVWSGRGSTAIAAGVDIDIILDGSIMTKLEMGLRKNRVHEITGIFPIEITEQGFHVNSDHPTMEPQGAWKGMLDQIKIGKTQAETDAVWILNLMKWAGNRDNETEVMMTYQDLKKQMGPVMSVSRIKDAVRHLRHTKAIRTVKNGGYMVRLDESELKKLHSKPRLKAANDI